jgi:hypothetical protein
MALPFRLLAERLSRKLRTVRIKVARVMGNSVYHLRMIGR